MLEVVDKDAPCVHCGQQRASSQVFYAGTQGALCTICYRNNTWRWTPEFIQSILNHGIEMDASKYDIEYLKRLPLKLRRQAAERYRAFIEEVAVIYIMQ